MNVKKKFRSKLRIFDSFGGKGDNQDDGDMDDTVPVLLAVKERLEGQKESQEEVEGQEEAVKIDKSQDKSLKRQR